VLASMNSLPVEGFAFGCTIVEHLLQECINGGGEPQKHDFKPSTSKVQDAYMRHVKFIGKLKEKNPPWAEKCVGQLCASLKSRCLGTKGGDNSDDSEAQLSDEDMLVNTDDEGEGEGEAQNQDTD